MLNFGGIDRTFSCKKFALDLKQETSFRYGIIKSGVSTLKVLFKLAALGKFEMLIPKMIEFVELNCEYLFNEYSIAI